MMNKLFYFFPLLFICLSLSSCQDPANKSYETDLSSYFGNYSGAFVLYDYNNKYYIKHNAEQCSTRFSPCSTFKLPNSLIGLETGVIKDENFIIPWDSVTRNREELNRDHDLSSAIKSSVVWYYQELARQVGEEKMKMYIDSLHYGNMDISGGIDKFWLDNSLKISADEQVGFMYKLYTDSLPFSKTNMDIVKRIIIQDTLENGAVFSGKTGSNGKDLGWFVGAVELGSNIYLFATNITGDGADGRQAREISREIIRSLKLIP
ncbi:MAG TPA: penicillin-binding transpeptidase domain-containing protein [Ignavibacteria bacterium]|nr:penicillin-binding transpeptidase domain-containing protein [Ignavibacteria bacterium]